MGSSHHRVGSLSPEMVLLGMLYKTPGHGYDLHRTVIADLGQVWHLSQSQAYAILKRLEGRGDISVEEIPQEKRNAEMSMVQSLRSKRFPTAVSTLAGAETSSSETIPDFFRP